MKIQREFLQKVLENGSCPWRYPAFVKVADWHTAVIANEFSTFFFQINSDPLQSFFDKTSIYKQTSDKFTWKWILLKQLLTL